jgi:transcriptional regulator with XRE-family HTH domain
MSLKLARKIARLTQEDLAKRAGLDNTTICRVERSGRDLRECDYQTVVRIAAALNLEPDELFAIAALPDPSPGRSRVNKAYAGARDGKRRASRAHPPTADAADRLHDRP